MLERRLIVIHFSDVIAAVALALPMPGTAMRESAVKPASRVAARPRPGRHCAAARQLAEYKLRAVGEKLRDLRRMESALKSAVADCV